MWFLLTKSNLKCICGGKSGKDGGKPAFDDARLIYKAHKQTNLAKLS